ncbi:MAG: IPT/TIG domain-containing protein [Candidatus Zixiibacteriota bacterium]
MRRNFIIIVLLILTALLATSCDRLFVSDGNDDEGITQRGGFFYFVDNENFDLVMMDRNLNVLKTWDTEPLFDTVRIQGITFDGKYIWLSSAGANDLLVQVDGSSDELIALLSLDAPPERHGTIRGIAFDGTFLWAVNSGSETYSTPPTLYKLDPNDGTVLEQYILPTPEPRALAYVGTNGDAYGRGAATGIYYGDVEKDAVFYFSDTKFIFDSVFASPVPPRGVDYIFPVALTFDGVDYWLVNSSSAGDHLYKINYRGLVLEMVELPYITPGPIVWTDKDIREANPPTVLAVSPNSGARTGSFTVSIIGSDFKSGAGLDVSFGEGIIVSNITFVSGSNIEVNIDIADDAEFGFRNVTVTNPDGQTGVGLAIFSVSSIDPLAGYIWMVNSENDTLYKITVFDSSIVQTWSILGVAPGGSPQGLTFDGTNIWMSTAGTDDAIMELNTSTSTLSVISSFTAPPSGLGTIREIAWDGTYIWSVNSGSTTGIVAMVYKHDPATGAILDSMPPPGAEPRGIVFANGDLYCNDRTLDSVYMYDTDTDTWVAQFATPIPPLGTESDRYATGMSWDGINFWIANSTYEFDYIFQVTTDGTVIRTYEVPDRGDAQPSGIVFTQD